MFINKEIAYLCINLYIYSACLGGVWLSFCPFLSNNAKTAELIGPNFFMGPRVTPMKFYEWSNFQKFASRKIRFLIILKIHETFYKILETFFIKSTNFFLNVYKENMFTIAIEYGRFRTDRAQIFCETLRDPRECLWINFFSRKFFFYNIYKEKNVYNWNRRWTLSVLKA